ncbi:hypothetical protein DL766_000270 [Monosporascus sp. MC13-8B]|uniref:HIT domain-containing protein n=1 Tax=Monosporascus cannonballus TaxID=155416 RepID=A0ABY0H4W8_9PEZI|nr:hypothetical protein DL763_008631 [Monosporascus cannonballus]RYO81564.1 hypothetical protein DL762_007055 [Monosporascus cannonballus]RYP39828.1 hypothetical protein DL766_000270 [Monosporascus sp. MC13-8B]
MAEMTRVQVPKNLPALVKSAFQRARDNGALLYYATQVTILNVGSIPFQLRYSPALASKPKAAKPKDPDAKPFNPFENPAPGLLVAQLPPAHRLVLNKFAVVPEHFILVTKEVKPQTHVLEKDDIAAAYACIEAYDRSGQELFVFFNSGKHSGASQPHRHLQLLPVARMQDGLEQVERGETWSVLADKLDEHAQTLPFAVMKAAITPGMSVEARHDTYLDLYKRAVNAVTPNVEVPSEGEANISYNLAMTKTSMAICPRTGEGAAIRNKTGQEVGYVSLNGTVLAGTALVKNQAEWDALGEDSSLLLGVLNEIGIKPSINGSAAGNL